MIPKTAAVTRRRRPQYEYFPDYGFYYDCCYYCCYYDFYCNCYCQE